MTEYRTTSYWQKVYDYALEIAALHDIDVTHSHTILRRRKRLRWLEDSVILETVGSRDESLTSDHFKCHLLFPILDKFLVELNNRFDARNILIMKGVSSCTPSSATFLCLSDLTEFARAYAIDIRSFEIECSLLRQTLSTTKPDITTLASFGSYILSRLPAYSILYEIVRVALTIAVTSAESERSFSTMKRIKTKLRTRMVQERLSDLSVLSIEKKIAQSIHS